METNFDFKSAICTDRFQSERLLALGLKIETADCYLFEYEKGKYKVIVEPWEDLIADEEYYLQYKDICFPAWSLHRLLSLLPQSVKIGKNYYALAIIQNEFVRLIVDIGDIYIYFDRVGIYESLLLCIEWLIKEGYFN